MAASFRWILQLHKDVPKAAKFYSEGLGLTINVCTLRWAELESGPLKLALMQSPSNDVAEKGYSSLISFTVSDINHTVTKLLSLGAELDGPIKYEIHGKEGDITHFSLSVQNVQCRVSLVLLCPRIQCTRQTLIG
ncbi:unnamed protein product [Cuscuta epithymum]|uniref:Glyoxalase/fosfomycin resistance/dioxygenase domain-containing protein n=1 Tax=Cuscuta epithymum TaxID=186058 RepID=A0AAV0BZM6_9ASTE|nr:unnamed protein product [Cuscuta epithymum]